MTPQEFIAAIGPAAQESSKITGIPASFTIAQAALESGWGKSQLAMQGFNLFGIKSNSDWRRSSITLPTKEFIGGKWIVQQAKWRKYSGWLDSINDHAKFLILNPRYRLAFTGKRTGEDFAQMIQSCGYATDPNYCAKVCAIIRQHKLDQFDEEK